MACATCPGTGEADGEPTPQQVRLHPQAVMAQALGTCWPGIVPAWLEGTGCVSDAVRVEQLEPDIKQAREGDCHITKTEGNAAAAPWVKECVGDRWFLSVTKGRPLDSSRGEDSKVFLRM